MSKFLTELDTEEIDDINSKLLSPFSYQSDVAQETITVPAGFITDFVSFRIGPMHLDVGRKASVIHDYGYRTPGFICKSLIDKVFLEAMKVDGVAWYRRWYMYLAVKYFGKASYKGGVGEPC